MEVDNRNQSKLLVVFGRPGSGKTTVANEAITTLQQQVAFCPVIGLDLDVCIPQWMKDNFARGKYPSLEERQAFATHACDYVDEQLADSGTAAGAIVSFSFVNTDLRTVFRSRFPAADWILIDTSVEEAQRRIDEREGHFYVGKREPESKEASAIKPDEDNSDWEFAPVDFPHIILDGKASIKENANCVVDFVLGRANEDLRS